LFTGIVQEVGRIISVTGHDITIAAGDILKGVAIGGSMAVNGVCLTITKFTDKTFTADVMPETFTRTNLGLLRPKDQVNLERPLTFNGEIGGHIVQGHVDDTAKVIRVEQDGTAIRMRFEADSKLMRYIVEKGFVAVDGTSLTVTERDTKSFGVSLIRTTHELSIIGSRRPGDIVNLEVDVIGKYVENLSIQQSTPITADFLQEHGFQVN
jgi:riboflavin synthase